MSMERRPNPQPGTKPPPPAPPAKRYPQARPVAPPNQWCKSRNDPHPFDVVTGDPRIDKQIAIRRGFYPKPWWHRIFRARES